MIRATICLVCWAAFCMPVNAIAGGNGDVTFIHMGDLHGHLIPRPNMREGDPDQGQMMGGLAYVYDEIKKIRKVHPNALLINGGDTVQGSAEALFTEGGAMVEILNKFKIDAFNPGNWDYVYGTERFRELFAGKKPLANWNALSANLYYSTLYDFPESRYAKQAGQRVLKPYMIRDVNGVRVGIVGLTADRGPQAVSTRVLEGFSMTPGAFEIAAAVPLLRKKHHVDLIVLISERGLGANLEMGLYICHATGSFPYTNVKFRWREILAAKQDLDATAQTWSPLTNAFRGLPFKFLDKVDSEFACTIRKEGRLEGFRSYLRKLWSAIGGELDPAKSEPLARDFRDELTQAYSEAQAEWGAIDRDLLKWAVPTVGGALVTGAFSPIIAGGLAVAGLGEIIQAEMKRRDFRKKVPMSVFIDLERK